MHRTILVILFSVGFSLQFFAQSFPQRCEGTWTGTMHIWSNGLLSDSVGIIFTVYPKEGASGEWIWKTEYISDKIPMTKNYTLIQSQNKLHEFLMDEGDGVLLTNYVFGNKMYSLFKVGKIWLTSSYEFVDESLVFEVTSGTISKVKSKGLTNYSCDFLQRVVLKKRSNEKG